MEHLSEVQKQAVLHRDGPLVVFAGAGSGKTRVITHRIANLIKTGVRPWEIVAVTFTNKAAAEMRQRLQRLTDEGSRAYISTFHSLCARWLREFGSHIGFKSDFSIYDDSDSQVALKKVIKENFKNIDLAPFVAEMRAFMHRAKIHAIFPGEVESSDLFDAANLPHGGIELYRRYQEYLASCQAMDFDDLILNVLLLLRRHPDVVKILQSRHRFFLVDEFQDTNPSQLELVERLSSGHKNLFVVGDDDQSIYSWRGATPAHLVNFQKKYPDAQQIILEQNYRSSSNIIAAANAVISHNQFRVEKKLYSEKPPTEPIVYRTESDGEMEAWYVADAIKRELKTFHYSDFAIFYRTNSQSRLMEEALRREDIPYRIFGAMKFYERAEIKDILSYLRLFVNEDDDVSLRRIINVPPRGIGDKTVEALAEAARGNNESMFKTIKRMVTDGGDGKLVSKLSVFLTLFETLAELIKARSMSELIPGLTEVLDYGEYLKKKYPEQYADKIENVHELSAALADFEKKNPEAKLSDWMQTVSLVRDDEDSEGGEEGVSLMTLHTAKGLEFERVFIIGVEDGLLPHRSNMEVQEDLEEERRLFYVGMTRAKQRLNLVSAHSRMVYNQYMANEPSMFLREIPADLLKVDRPTDSLTQAEELEEGGTRYEYGEDSSGLGSQIADIYEGMLVKHPSYGRGVLEGVEDNFGKVKAVVRFFEFGRRKVSLGHIERID